MRSVVHQVSGFEPQTIGEFVSEMGLMAGVEIAGIELV
jgi:hypothetical protein